MPYGALNREIRCEECDGLLVMLESRNMKCFNCEIKYDFDIELEKVED